MKEENVQSPKFAHRYIRWHQENRFAGKLVFVALCSLLALIVSLYGNMPQAHASAAIRCSGSERAYTIVAGDTLSGIAAAHGSTVSALATRNAIANPNVIYAGQRLCVPASTGRVLAPVQSSSASVRTMIHSVFGAYAGPAMRIAICESGLNPNAVNSIAVAGSHAQGVFQILYPSTWSTTSQARHSPFNAYFNIVAAHEIFVRDGYSWREWACRP